jgi:hypothetical protein
VTYRGLTFGEWVGSWACFFRILFCGLRGHQWGRWSYEVPYEEGLGVGTRMCQRCDAYEERLPQ